MVRASDRVKGPVDTDAKMHTHVLNQTNTSIARAITTPNRISGLRLLHGSKSQRLFCKSSEACTTGEPDVWRAAIPTIE